MYHPDHGSWGKQPYIKRPRIMSDDEDQLPNWEIKEPLRVVISRDARGMVICGADEVGELPACIQR